MSHTFILAQLDLEHWFPPYYRGEDIVMEETYLYISTDRSDPFPVNIYNNNILIDQVIVSKGSPVSYFINDDSMIDTGVVRRTMTPVDMGFHLSGQYSFFASLRIAGCSARAGCISEIFASKGKSALGKEFFLVNDKNVLYGNSAKDKNYQASVMATQDNTHIKFTNYDKRLKFSDGRTEDEINVTLNKGQSFIFLALKKENNISNPPILDDNDPNPIGSLITSDKPIVVSNGNIASQDIGESGGNANMDQSVPIEKLGKEYFMVNGMTKSEKGVMEKILVVATKDNTKLYFNNEINSYTTLNKGEYFIGPYGTHKFVDSSQPSFKNAESKIIPTTAMYIKASEPIYLYQMIGGFQNLVRGPGFNQTYSSSGMTFSYPIDKDYSSLPSQSHNNSIVIPYIEKIGAKSTETKLNIKSPKSAIIKLNGNTLTSYSEIIGKEDWKYFSIPLIKGNVEISSDQSLMIDVLGGFMYSGYGSSYTGFSNDPYINVNGDCIQEGVFLSLSNVDFEGFQWKKNGVNITGATSSVYQPTQPGSYNCVVSYPGFTFSTPSVNVVDCPYNIFEIDAGNVCSPFTLKASFLSGSHLFSKLEVTTQPLNGTSKVVNEKVETIIKNNSVSKDRFVYKLIATDGYYEIVKVNFQPLPNPIADIKDGILPYKHQMDDNYYYDLSTIINNYNGETFRFYPSKSDAEGQTSAEIKDKEAYLTSLAKVFVFIDNGKCSVIKEVQLLRPPVDPETQDILLPNVFSPNGDGVNDNWDYSVLKDFENVTVSVYNKLGKEVYRHTDSFLWDGKDFNKNPLHTDNYWVVFSFINKGIVLKKSQWLLLKNR